MLELRVHRGFFRFGLCDVLRNLRVHAGHSVDCGRTVVVIGGVYFKRY